MKEGATGISGAWRRFRAGGDGFTFTREPDESGAGDYYTAHVVAPAERVLDAFLALTVNLPDQVDVAIDEVRSDRQWLGPDVSLAEARDEIGRLKVPLIAYGGVEIALYNREDQVTLSPWLELFIYARTDRWLYLLQGHGLEERRVLRPRRWKMSRSAFQPAPAISQAVSAVAQRLTLRARPS